MPDGKIRLPETQLDYAEVMFKRFGMQGGTLVGDGQVKTSVKDEFGEKSTSAFWFVAAGAAEVEVDLDTGKFKLIKYATAVDVGKALNPLGCRQQLAGAAITGIGQAMFEEIAYDNGQLINPNLVDYVLPSLGDMPAVIDPICVEVPDRNGPFGAKGIGESALIPVAPAIANAIYDAVGVRIKDLPIKAEKIYLGIGGSKRETMKGFPIEVLTETWLISAIIGAFLLVSCVLAGCNSEALEKQTEQLRRQEIEIARQRKDIERSLARDNRFKIRKRGTAIAHFANTSRRRRSAATAIKRLLLSRGTRHLSG